MSERVRLLRKSVRDGSTTPREADDQASRDGLPTSYDGFSDLGDITVGVTWWLPLATLFYAWRDLDRVRIEWERYGTWGRHLWRDPIVDPQVMSLESAEDMLLDDLRAGLLKAFGATENRAAVLIPHSEWEKLTVQKNNLLWWATDQDGGVKYKAVFVLRHEIVPLWLQETTLAHGAPTRRERSGSSQGGRLMADNWHDMWAEVCRIVHEEGLPPDRLTIVKRMQQWFADQDLLEPAPQKLNPILDRLFKALGR